MIEIFNKPICYQMQMQKDQEQLFQYQQVNGLVLKHIQTWAGTEAQRNRYMFTRPGEHVSVLSCVSSSQPRYPVFQRYKDSYTSPVSVTQSGMIRSGVSCCVIKHSNQFDI